MRIDYSMKFFECIKKCIKNLSLKFIEKILIVVIIWGILSIIFSLLLQPFINYFGFKLIYGVSINTLFSMILVGYICFLSYSKIASFNFISNTVRNLKLFFKDCSCTKKNPDDPPKKKKYEYESAKFAYEKILQIRDLDNQLMWTRINILIVFQGVLFGTIAAGFYTLKINQPKLLILLTGIGLFSSIALYSIAKGGSWWISHWETTLAEIEPSVIEEIEIFSGPHHHATSSKFKSEKKEEGYVSTRDWILIFTMALPLLWIIIFTYCLSFL